MRQTGDKRTDGDGSVYRIHDRADRTHVVLNHAMNDFLSYPPIFLFDLIRHNVFAV